MIPSRNSIRINEDRVHLIGSIYLVIDLIRLRLILISRKIRVIVGRRRFIIRSLRFLGIRSITMWINVWSWARRGSRRLLKKLCKVLWVVLLGVDPLLNEKIESGKYSKILPTAYLVFKMLWIKLRKTKKRWVKELRAPNIN